MTDKLLRCPYHDVELIWRERIHGLLWNILCPEYDCPVSFNGKSKESCVAQATDMKLVDRVKRDAVDAVRDDIIDLISNCGWRFEDRHEIIDAIRARKSSEKGKP